MKKQVLKKNNQGFSLVEIIIVIAIMAILVAIVAPNFIGYLDKARKARDLEMARVLGTALERVLALDDPALKDWQAVGTPGKSEVVYEVIDPQTNEKYKVYNMFEWTLTEKGDITGGAAGNFRHGILRDAHRNNGNGGGAGMYANLWNAYVDELAQYDINIFYRKYNIRQYRIVKRVDNGSPEVWVCGLEKSTEDGEGRGVHLYFRLWPNNDPEYMVNKAPTQKNTTWSDSSEEHGGWNVTVH
ncbi:MAG: prepilin-type N-terminal cleavage/methylation domain-containing protein [Lachnospiraceae bacterium]|nr:prepilin-type N-terminal cleavage/methylation domain-containing protein [Lachnospiraceae bacterium]